METELVTSSILEILCYLAAAVIAVPLFRKLGLGAILGYLAAGVCLGPNVLAVVHNPEHVLHFAEFGVVMLLFMIGLELAPDKLWEMRRSVGISGTAQLFISAILLASLLALFNQMSLLIAVVIGLTFALSSTAFAVQLLAEKRILGSPLGRQGLAILLLQDIAVIPLLLFVESVSPGSNTSMHVMPWWVGAITILGLVILSRLILNPILTFIAQYGSREVMTAAALLIVLGVSALMQFTGLSMGLGAFTAGMLLANSNYRHQLEADIEPFKGLLMGLFFIAVGMKMNIDLLLQKPWLIIGIALCLMIVKTMVITVINLFQKFNLKESILLGIILSQGGEFAFIVMTQALSMQLISSSLNDYVVLVVGVSMCLTVPLVQLLEFVVRHQTTTKDKFATDFHGHVPEVIIAGFGRFGQIIGRMLAASKIPFTALDKDANHVAFIQRFGNRIVYGDATRMDLLQTAGVAQAKLLVIAVDDVEDSLRIVRLVREQYPNLMVVARARNRNHAYLLHSLSIKYIIRETLESSLQAAVYTLIELGYTEGQALEKADMFRLHDEQILLEAVSHKDNQEKLLNIAQQGRKELEQLFNND